MYHINSGLTVAQVSDYDRNGFGRFESETGARFTAHREEFNAKTVKQWPGERRTAARRLESKARVSAKGKALRDRRKVARRVHFGSTVTLHIAVTRRSGHKHLQVKRTHIGQSGLPATVAKTFSLRRAIEEGTDE